MSKTGFVYILDIPIKATEASRRRFAGEIRKFAGTVEEFGKVKIDNNTLRDAIATYDMGRALLREMYELRKREIPPLTGGEVLGITTAAMVMPRDEFNRELEDLLPYLARREAKVSYTRPRILLSGDLLDNPAYLNLVEETGCLVAMDDLDTGSRYFWETVGGGEDPAYALARRYLKNRSARMLDWDAQAEQLVQWAGEFRVDGVLDLSEKFDYTREFRRPFMERRLKEAGISEMSFERDYHLANVGQLKTRIGAFLEMLESKAAG